MRQPPKFPWVKGVQPDYRSIAVRVAICQDNDRNVWSYSDLEDEQDQQTASTMESRGVEQIAFGLLCEAIRREAYLQVLVRLTDDEKYMVKYGTSDEATATKMRLELAESLKAGLKGSVDMLALDAATEILAMLAESGD